MALSRISPELEEEGLSTFAGLLACFSESFFRDDGDCQLSSELRLIERSLGVTSFFLFFRGLSFLISCFLDLLFNFLSSLSTAESRGLELSRFFFCLKIELMMLGLVFTSLADLDFLSSSELSEGEAGFLTALGAPMSKSSESESEMVSRLFILLFSTDFSFDFRDFWSFFFSCFSFFDCAFL